MQPSAVLSMEIHSEIQIYQSIQLNMNILMAGMCIAIKIRKKRWFVKKTVRGKRGASQDAESCSWEIMTALSKLNVRSVFLMAIRIGGAAGARLSLFLLFSFFRGICKKFFCE